MEESFLWLSISKMGLKFRWFNEVIYLCEYLPDGLTHNIKEIVKKNWETHIYCANFSLTVTEIPIKEKFRECVRYYRYGFFGKKTLIDLYRECNNKILSIPSIIIACLYKVK